MYLQRRDMTTSPKNGTTVGLLVGMGKASRWIFGFFDNDSRPGVWREEEANCAILCEAPRGWVPHAELIEHLVSAGIVAPITELTLMQAIEEVRPHYSAWVQLLTDYTNTLPPDTAPTPESEGDTRRGYAEHELSAMKRDLGALLHLAAKRS